jgi:hypothetical protein
LLASVANAGLFASSSHDLRPFGEVSLGGAWLVPGIILVGACVALAVGDASRSAVAVVAASVCGAVWFGLALAAPGLSVAPLRVVLIDRGTTFGLVALLMNALFGMAGLGIVWIVRSFVAPSDV